MRGTGKKNPHCLKKVWISHSAFSQKALKTRRVKSLLVCSNACHPSCWWGVRRKKPPERFNGSESVFSFSWEANFNRDGMFTIKGRKKSRKERLLNRSFHVFVFVLGSQAWLPTASSPNWPSWSSEHCETFPFQTHILLPSSGQRSLLSAQTFPHSVFLLLNHWDLCLEYFLFPFQPALALVVRSLELPLLLVLSAYPSACPTVVIQSLWWGPAESYLYISHSKLKSQRGTRHNGLRPPMWKAAKQQEQDEPS